MQQSFYGIHKVTFDDRGRLALPSVLKEKEATAKKSKVVFSEGMEVIVSVAPEGCLTFYKDIEWEREIVRMEERYKDDELHRAAWMRIVSFAEKQKIDSMGRILIPDSMMEFAEITAPAKKTAFLSVEGNHFRVWNSSNWKEELDWLKGLRKRPSLGESNPSKVSES